MNLHITHDNVFIDYVIEAAKELGVLHENRFCVYSHQAQGKLNGVKSKEVESSHKSKFRELIGDLSKYKTVYAHWLHHDFISEIMCEVPANIKTVWCFWGGDGLELPELLTWVYQPKSYELFNKMNKLHFTLHPKKIKEHFEYINSEKRWHQIHLKAVKRIDYFAHYLPDDYEKVIKHCETEMKFLPFFYAPVEKLTAQATPAGGNDIILGNSDTITNNHLEAIDKLSSLNLKDRKIICPLSYHKGKYASIIKKYGEEKLGESFFPLMDFMPLPDYNKLLSSVGYAVFNHNRSQALGNIYVFLKNGTKLFMSEDSTLYQFFKRSGFVVFSIQKDLEVSQLKPLTSSEMELNNKLLIDLFGNNAHMRNMKNLLSV